MKDTVKRAIAAVRTAREHYRKLSRRQRAFYIVGGAALLLTICLFVLSASQPDYKVVLTEDSTSAPGRWGRLVTALESRSIPWREGRDFKGARTLEVPEAKGAEVGELLVRELGASKSASMEWSDKSSSSIFETPERLDARLREINRVKIEQAILSNERIHSATLALSPANRSGLGFRRDGGPSAAVFLVLKPGAQPLSVSEAESIRDLVRCAFNINPEQVAITDSLGRRYERSSDSGPPAAVEEKEERLRTLIKEEIRRVYLSSFSDQELSVAVLVALSPQRTSLEKKEMDREKTFPIETESQIERGGEGSVGGVMSASDRGVTVKEIVKSTPFDSYAKSVTETPPGELKGVSVTAYFDLEAVERVELALSSQGPRDRPREGAGAPSNRARESLVRAFVEREEEKLRAFLSVLGNVKAGVVVHPFMKKHAEAPVALASGIVPPAPNAEAQGAGWSGIVWGFIAALALAVGLAWVQGKKRKLADSEWGHAWGRRPHESSLGRGEIREQRVELETGILDSVSSLNARARERPEAAASILRVWLSQDGEEAKEGAMST